LKQHFKIIGKITIRVDSVVDVDGTVKLTDKSIDHLPVKFGKVHGNFNCSYSNITILDGSPESVSGNFSCRNTKITSLRGSPQSVGGYVNFCSTQISSFEGSTKSLNGEFYFKSTPLEQLLETDEATQIDAVSRYPWQMFSWLMENNISTSQSVQLVAVSHRPRSILLIENPTRLIQITAVKANPKAIEWIADPDPLVQQFIKRK